MIMEDVSFFILSSLAEGRMGMPEPAGVPTIDLEKAPLLSFFASCGFSSNILNVSFLGLYVPGFGVSKAHFILS
jgi:hypothetical protein